EIFQRGPPVHQAANSHPGPHRKIFTIAAVGRLVWMLRQPPAFQTFTAPEGHDREDIQAKKQGLKKSAKARGQCC
ncbi:hypothetical protein PXK00_18265, partial [Phaeobacter sp. QD34_3]|uniref:hypothetical protein n=1 Tax=unclassified Phaeobacter TaxID=2621772 RepID=UPI00237F5308